MQTTCVVAANHDGEVVIETERSPDGEVEFGSIPLFYALVNIHFVATRLLFKNFGQRSAGIFQINIDYLAEYCLLADERARQIETALDRKVSAVLNDLSKQLAENELLGEILGADYDA